jgi:K+ transporter
MAEALKVKKSSPVLIAAAWVIVVLPTLWGLNYTVQNAMKIFAKPAASSAAKPTAPAAAPAK